MIKVKGFDNKIDIRKDAMECGRFARQYWNIDEHFSEQEFKAVIDRIVDFTHGIYKDMLYKHLMLEIAPIKDAREKNIENGLVTDETKIGEYEGLGKEFSIYDSKLTIMDGLSFACGDYVRAKSDECGMYSKDRVSELLKILKNEFPKFDKLAPRDYKKFLVGYSEFDGMEDIDEDGLMDAFCGHKTQCSDATSYDFPIRIQKEHIAYDDESQGRKPPLMLAYAFLGHLYGLEIHNNTVAFMDELKAIDVEAPVSFNDFQSPKEGWIGKVWEYAPEFCKNGFVLTEETVSERYKRKAELANMSEEEREALRKKHAEEILQEIFGEDGDFKP